MMMKTYHGQVSAKAGRDTDFDIQARSAVPRAVLDVEFGKLKNRLLSLEAARVGTFEQARMLRLAATDAAGLAWLTPFPLLVLPQLFEETVEAARKREALQEDIRQRSQVIVAEAI
jgi:hypothetical protein